MKKWQEPNVMELGVENTKEGGSFDYPHFLACQLCGKHQTEAQINDNGGFCINDTCNSQSFDWTTNPERS